MKAAKSTSIHLADTGKKFGNSFVFRHLNEAFTNHEATAILGSNGSGKSTLLRILSGLMLPTEGRVKYSLDHTEVAVDEIHRHIAIAAPYMDLFENLTLWEIVAFHRKLKGFNQIGTDAEMLQKMALEAHGDKLVSSLSSGMKQRLRLGLAVYSQAEILLLDEPLTNLDEKGKNWYQGMLLENLTDRLVIVCSNHVQEEYSFCQRQVEL